MHDLEPQDQPAEQGLAKARQRLDRDPSCFASHEREADLSTLGEDALATEAKREALRDQRQERQARAEEAMQRRREGAPPAGRASLDQRRGERELFFWTAREILKLVVAVVLTAYLLISLVTGHDPVPQGLSFWK